MFEKILVAVDGSRAAEQGLIDAIALAEWGGSQLTLFTAARQPPGIGFLGVGRTGALSFVKLAVAEAEVIASQAGALVPEHLRAATVVSRRPVGPALVRQIVAGGHDLVVLGSRGRGNARSVVLGSVSRHVLGHSPVPVLIARAGTPVGTASELP